MSRNLHANTLENVCSLPAYTSESTCLANGGTWAPVISQSKHQMFHLLTFLFDVPFRLTTHSHDIKYTFSAGEETFLSSGRLMSAGNPIETIAISNPSISITLTGANEADIALALTEDYNDRQVIIRRGFYDTSGATTDANIIADPFEIFNGRVDSYSIDDNPTSGDSSVTWNISSHFADWQKVNGRKCTNTSAQVTFPDEEGFSHIYDAIGSHSWGSIRS